MERMESEMAEEIKEVIINSRTTLVSDAVGAASLIVILLAALGLPGLF